MDAKKHDPDPQETREWIDALDAVLAVEGPDRAHLLIEQLIEKRANRGAYLPFSANTAYINTIPTEAQVRLPGDQEVEHRIRSYVRWNAMAMVLRANNANDSAATSRASRRPQRCMTSASTISGTGLREPRWRSRFLPGPLGDRRIRARVHARPADGSHLDSYRQEVGGRGISSYPHPWLMPDFWQFPTVSMGLGPLMAIYQARFMNYLQDRGLAQTEGRKVGAHGRRRDGRAGIMGAIGMASRENLDNLIFVVNCNLQRLDGPVRGNGKIIQELESDFRGAGWNVIKLIWGTHWDALLARDKKGILMKRMMEALDGEYQTFKSKNGAYVREYFFNTPELKALVRDYSDDDIWHLNRGGHDPHKIYAAFHVAAHHKGQPTVILAKTIKGYGMGTSGEARQHAPAEKDVERVAHTFPRPLPDPRTRRQARRDSVRHVCRRLARAPVHAGAKDRTRRLPPAAATEGTTPLTVPELGVRTVPQEHRRPRDLDDDGVRADPADDHPRQEPRQARRADRARRVADLRHGGHVPALGIWNQQGQLYTPQDHDQLMFYKEDKHGQILQEGINEAGGMCDWIAAATSYSTPRPCR